MQKKHFRKFNTIAIHDKTLSKQELEGNFFSIIKESKKRNLTSNVIFSGERLNAFPVRQGTGQGHPFSLLLSNILLEDLVNSIQEKEKIKYMQIGREKIKLSYSYGYD